MAQRWRQLRQVALPLPGTDIRMGLDPDLRIRMILQGLRQHVQERLGVCPGPHH